MPDERRYPRSRVGAITAHATAWPASWSSSEELAAIVGVSKNCVDEVGEATLGHQTWLAKRVYKSNMTGITLAAIIEIVDNTSLAMHSNVLLSVETELKRFRTKKDV